MLKTVSFTIYDKPIPLKRHRHSGRCTYNPQKQEQETIRILMQTYINQYSQMPDPPLSGPLHATFKFYFALPKTKRLREKKKLFRDTKPDLSNLLKFYEDCMNSLIYKDDAQIVKIDAIKCYTADKERTEVTITQIEQADIITPLIKDTSVKEPKYENAGQKTFYGAVKAK